MQLAPALVMPRARHLIVTRRPLVKASALRVSIASVLVSPARLLATRDKLYELLAKCIPADVIIKTLADELMKNIDDSIKHDVVRWAAFYEHRITQGNKEIFHLEAFVAKFMCIYKKFMDAMFA